ILTPIRPGRLRGRPGVRSPSPGPVASDGAGPALCRRREDVKTLARPADRSEITERLRRLRPENPRRWGRMSAHQAVCHMSDAFRVVLGTMKVVRKRSLVPRAVRRWLAIRLPFAWPAGIPTWPEIDAFVGGTRPATFEADRSELERLISAFVAERQA